MILRNVLENARHVGKYKITVQGYDTGVEVNSGSLSFFATIKRSPCSEMTLNISEALLYSPNCLENKPKA